jgi:hypothetical protein
VVALVLGAAALMFCVLVSVGHLFSRIILPCYQIKTRPLNIVTAEFFLMTLAGPSFSVCERLSWRQRQIGFYGREVTQAW